MISLQKILFTKIFFLSKFNNLTKDLLFGIPTNLRFRVEPNIDFSHMRSLITYVDVKLPYPSFGKFENIWSDSKLVDEVVAKAVDMQTGAIFKHSHNFEDIQEMNDLFSNTNDMNYLINFMNSISKPDVSMSNAGTYVFKKKQPNPSEPFKIVEVYFTDSLCNTRACLLSSIYYHVSYWNGKLMFALCSNKASIGSEFTERLIEIYRKNLEKSVEQFEKN